MRSIISCRFLSPKNKWFYTFLCQVVAVVGIQAVSQGMPAKPAPKALPLADALKDKGSANALHQSYQAHSLLELIDSDEQKNLVVQSPLMAVDALRRFLAFAQSKGLIKVTDPLTSMPADFIYKALHTGKKRIEGKFSEVAKLVNTLRGGAYVPALVGPPGTGKTYLTEVLPSVANDLAAESPKFRLWRYQWKNLQDIPALVAQKVVKRNKEVSEADPHGWIMPHTRMESPINLLPENLRNRLLSIINDEIEAMTGLGNDPLIQGLNQAYARLSPRNQHIYDEILRHHSAELSTDQSIVEVISNYVDVLPMDPSENFQVVTKQEEEVDWASLIGEEDLVMKTVGSVPAFERAETGQLHNANGGLVVFDEFLRNGDEMLGGALHLLESKSIVKGQQTIPLDVVMIMAYNSDSSAELKGDRKYRALYSRRTAVPFKSSLRPLTTAKTLLLMAKTEGRMDRYQQRLGLDENGEPYPIEPLNLDDVYPTLPKEGEGTDLKLVGPERRYAIYIGSGANRVKILPHTLNLLASFVTGTRFLISPDRLAKDREKLQTKTDLVNNQVIRNPVSRLLFASGDLLSSLKAPLRRDMDRISTELNEGEWGILERAGWIILSNAISAAQQPDSPSALTPFHITQAIDGYLLDADNHDMPIAPKLQAEWRNMLMEIMHTIIVPKINRDIQFAAAGGTNDTQLAYQRFIREAIALFDDPEAQSFLTSDNTEEFIDREKFQAIRKLYKELTQNDLDIGKLATLHRLHLSQPEAWTERDTNLEWAINTYYFNQEVVQSDIFRLLSREASNDQDAAVRQTVLERLVTEYGYEEETLTMIINMITKSRPAQTTGWGR